MVKLFIMMVKMMVYKIPNGRFIRNMMVNDSENDSENDRYDFLMEIPQLTSMINEYISF